MESLILAQDERWRRA